MIGALTKCALSFPRPRRRGPAQLTSGQIATPEGLASRAGGASQQQVTATGRRQHRMDSGKLQP